MNNNINTKCYAKKNRKINLTQQQKNWRLSQTLNQSKRTKRDGYHLGGE